MQVWVAYAFCLQKCILPSYTMQEIFELLCDKFCLYNIRMKRYSLSMYSLQPLIIATFNDGTSDIYWNRLTRIRWKKQMPFRIICSQVVETKPFNYIFCSHFKIIHGFIKCRTKFVKKGIISKISKVTTKVLEKWITMIDLT